MLFTLCEDEVKYSIEECKERDATYAAPLKVEVRLHNKESGDIVGHEIFMGDLPIMTRTGTSVKLSSLWSVETSLAIVAISFGSSPNVSIISAFVPIPKARINTVIGTFLFLSTLT